MEGDYGSANSPPLSDGESYGGTAPKLCLSALFAMEQQKLLSGNSSFRYHPPKLQSSAAKGVTPVTGFASNKLGPNDSYNSAPSLQVLHSVAVLQLLISNPSGGKNFIGNAGMAVLETSSSRTKDDKAKRCRIVDKFLTLSPWFLSPPATDWEDIAAGRTAVINRLLNLHPLNPFTQTYQLVLYDASKRTLADTSLNQEFRCTPKADCWVNFIAVNQSWSALFNSTEDWVDFARAVVFARSLVARVSDSFSDVLIQDISPQQDIHQAGLRQGDMVQVTYKAWIEKPGFPGTLGHCFRETAGKGKKLELGSGKAIQGLEQGMIGMTKSSRRLLIIPPHLAYGSSLERPDRVPDDAVLFFDVTVSRTRRHKGSVSETSYGEKGLLSDQLSYNDDAGSEREELTAPNFLSVDHHDAVKMVNASSREEIAQEDKDLSNEKKGLLIDRMAKLSRIGGAGSYNLSPSSVVAHHKRFSIETSQPSSPSSVAATPERFTVETSQLSLDGFYESRDSSNPGSVGVEGSDINDTLKSTSSSTVAIEDNVDHVVKLMEEDDRSESGNHLPEWSDVDDETKLASRPTVSQRVDHQHPKLDEAVADVPFPANEHAGVMENSRIMSTAEVAGHSEIFNSCYRAMSTGTSNPLSNPEALRPQSPRGTMPSSSPALPAQWAPIWPFAYPPFVFPPAADAIPSNSNAVPPPYSVTSAGPLLQPMGPLPYVPTALPGQVTQPYLGHPAFIPWFPWGFPHYAPAPYSIPAAESKHENQLLKVILNIQAAQESFAESLKNLTVKVEALSEVNHKRSGPHENEQSSGHGSLGLGQGSKGSIFQEQVSSEDGDNQVDSLVESVALMLAENRELRRRLSENKNQSPTVPGVVPSIEQSCRRLLLNMEDIKLSEDPGSSSEVPQLNLGRKSQSDLMSEPTNVSPRDFSKDEAELTIALENEMKSAMNKVYREVAEKLIHIENVEQSLPVVHEKLMKGVEDLIQFLHEKSLSANPGKSSSNLESLRAQDTQVESQRESVGSPTHAGMKTGGGSQ